MAIPGSSFPGGMPGEPTTPSDAPYATGGKAQPISGPKPKKVKVRSHTRTIKPKAPKPPKPPKAAPGLDATTKSLIDAAVRLKFGGQDQALNQQLAGAQRFAAGVPAWYQQAIQQIKAQQTPVAPVQAPVPTGDPAADSRANLNSAFAQQLAQRQGAQNDFLTNVGAGLVTQQGNVLNQNALQQNQIRQAQTQLAGQKGDFRASTLSDMQAAQQKANLEQAKINASLAIASGKLDLAQNILNTVTKPKAQADIRKGRSQTRLNKRKQAATENQNAVNNALKVNKLALDSYLAAHPELKTKGGRTASGKSAFTPTQTRKAASTFRTLAASLDENAVMKDPNGAINALVKGKKTDPVVANAVVESILNHGSVTRETATAYYRATGHHLHVGKNAKHVGKSVGEIFQSIMQKLGQ